MSKLGAPPGARDARAGAASLRIDEQHFAPVAGLLVHEIQRTIKALLGIGARMPKELMLFTKNLMFVDGAIATLAPDLDILEEIAHITMYFATTHGEKIAAHVVEAFLLARHRIIDHLLLLSGAGGEDRDALRAVAKPEPEDPLGLGRPRPAPPPPGPGVKPAPLPRHPATPLTTTSAASSNCSGGYSPSAFATAAARLSAESPVRNAATRAELTTPSIFSGVRSICSQSRSATIALFSPDDEEMMTAKTGNWFDVNPQRAASNNSTVRVLCRTSIRSIVTF